MALISCPDCGKEISDRADHCIHCGCPVGSAQDGVLRVQLNSFLKLLGTMSICVEFGGEEKVISRGYYQDFVVPADGKIHTGTISCGRFGSYCEKVFNISLKSGESKKIFIIYDDSKFLQESKWLYREEFFSVR